MCFLNIQKVIFINLEEELPNDIFVALSEQLYFGKVEVNSDDELDSNKTKPYGIILDNLSYYENTDFPDGEKRILGIVSNSRIKIIAFPLFVTYLKNDIMETIQDQQRRLPLNM